MVAEYVLHILHDLGPVLSELVLPLIDFFAVAQIVNIVLGPLPDLLLALVSQMQCIPRLDCAKNLFCAIQRLHTALKVSALFLVYLGMQLLMVRILRTHQAAFCFFHLLDQLILLGV